MIAGALLSQLVASHTFGSKMVLKIGINGFGRIGRLVMRAAKADPAVQVLLATQKAQHEPPVPRHTQDTPLVPAHH